MTVSNDNAQFDPELDALLATAHWPEPTPQAVGRLRDEWHGLIAPRPLRIRWFAAAAVFLLVIG